MSNAFGKLGIMIAAFLGSWFVLSFVNWIELFEIHEKQASIEEKIGELYWDMFNSTEEVVEDERIIGPVDSLLRKICTANDIDREEIKFHILEKDMINAFALPDGHLVLLTGLINEAENEGELAGVLCHELGHIQEQHVMEKLLREVGLAVLVTMTSGNGGGELAGETLKLFSSTAYDRKLEKEADIKAVDYMINADLDPEQFATFMYKMTTEMGEIEAFLASWVSTHPASEDRAQYIIEYSADKAYSVEQTLSDSTWMDLKAACQELEL